MQFWNILAQHVMVKPRPFQVKLCSSPLSHASFWACCKKLHNKYVCATWHQKWGKNYIFVSCRRHISKCGQYSWLLIRIWNVDPWISLNISMVRNNFFLSFYGELSLCYIIKGYFLPLGFVSIKRLNLMDLH